MNRFLKVFVVFVIVVAACGGGDGDTATTATPGGAGDGATTQAPATTGAPAVTVGNDFCAFVVEYADNASFSPIGISPAEVEAAFTNNLDALNQAAGIAPSEIQDDVRLFVDAYGGFVDFLREYDWNFLSIPENALEDPRLSALDDPTLDAAGARIEEFCGIDGFVATPPSAPGAGGGGGGGVVPGGTLPDDFPEALVPPGGEVSLALNVGGVETVTFEIDGASDDVIAYYTDLLGPPLSELTDPAGALWMTQFEGGSVTVTVTAITADTSQANVIRS